jgi:hypothetical protein
MSDWEDDINRHAEELVRLTLSVFDEVGREGTLPEDELATLGMLIATERQFLIDAVSAQLYEDEPEAAARPGVAEFDAGFRYGLEFSRAIDDAKLVLERVRRGRLLKLVRGGDRK